MGRNNGVWRQHIPKRLAEKKRIAEKVNDIIVGPREGMCGAKTRSGTLCQRKDLLNGERCRLHGGMSTGPKTLEGRRRSALNIGKSYDELLAEKQRRLTHKK